MSPHPLVVQLFLAYFGRAPEYEAAVYYSGVFAALAARPSADGGDPRLDLANMIYMAGVGAHEVPESVQIDDAVFVRQLYTGLLGREAEPDGLAYWFGELQHDMSREAVTLAFIAAAEGSATDSLAVEHRSEVAVQFAQWQNSNPGILSELPHDAAQVILGVGADPASVEAAYALLWENRPDPGPGPGPGPGPQPQSFLLTLEQDILTGTAADDTFIAVMRPSPTGLAPTLQTGDVLDGGAGEDVLEADLGGVSAAPTVLNIETLRLYNTGTGQATLDLAQASGHRDIDFLASTAGMLLSNVGDIASLSVAGAQGGVIALEGVTSFGDLSVEFTGTSRSGGNVEVWLGDEDSTYAADGPYVYAAHNLSLTLRDNATAVQMRNTVAENELRIDAEGTNRLLLDAVVSEQMVVVGAGELTLSSPTEFSLTGHLILYGEYLRVLDTSGFTGELSGMLIDDADAPEFENAVIRLGEGRQTLAFTGPIADGVRISGGVEADSWTTLEFTQGGYDSFVGFAAGNVTDIDQISLNAFAGTQTYQLAHGAQAFSFGYGIEGGETATLVVGEALDGFIELRGSFASGYGDLVVDSEGVLSSAEIRLAVSVPGGAGSVNLEFAAERVVLDAAEAGGGIGGWYAVHLRDAIVLGGDPAGSIAQLVITGDKYVELDISGLGNALESIDGSGANGGFEVTLTGFAGIGIVASPGADSFIIETGDIEPALAPNMVAGIGADDWLMFFMNDDAQGVGALAVDPSAADLSAALNSAYDLLDSSGGAKLGWFEYDGATYFVAEEVVGSVEQYASIGVLGTDLDFTEDSFGSEFSFIF